MKKSLALALLVIALLLSGCSKAEDPHPEWESLVRADNLLAVQTPEGFALAESNDALAANGIYYFAWGQGEGRTITNAEEENATVYDCQIYLLVTQCKDADSAKRSIADWKDMESEIYRVESSTEIPDGVLSFDCLTLSPTKTDSPFTSGAAAFAARDDLAISAEIFCTGDFSGDQMQILEDFLSGIRLG